MRGRTTAIVTTCLLIWASLSMAADHCVRAGATGTGSGDDWTNAYTALPSTLVRGDTYYIADGTYSTYTFDDAVSSTSLITIKKATTTTHGPDTGWSDAYGDGTATWGDVTFTTSYWVFDGASGGGPTAWTTGHGFAFTSAAGTSHEYITISGTLSNLTVRHVSFVQVGDTESTTARADAIYSATSISDSTFEYLYMDNLGGLPFLLRAGSNNIFQYTYTGNICGMSVKDPAQHCEALVIHDMDNVHFRWNYITESPSSGGFVKNNTQTVDAIRIYGNIIGNGFPIQCNSGPCTNWRIFNNTFYNITSGPTGGDGTKTGWLTYNNIIFDGAASALTSPHDYNWWSQITSHSCSMTVGSQENCTARYPSDCDLCAQTADPFVSSATGDFHLAALITGWPGTNICLLDSCAGTNDYDVDMYGTTRTWSRGAIEYQDTTTPNAPTDLRVVIPE